MSGQFESALASGGRVSSWYAANETEQPYTPRQLYYHQYVKSRGMLLLDRSAQEHVVTTGYTVAKSSTFAPVDTDDVMVVDTTGGNVTADLPTAVGRKGKRFGFIKIAAANNLVIDPNGAETVDGAATKTFSNQYQRVYIISDGANWFVESDSSGNGVTGSGVAGQVTIWTGANTIGGDAGMTYSAANDTLTITGTTNIRLRLTSNHTSTATTMAEFSNSGAGGDVTYTMNGATSEIFRFGIDESLNRFAIARNGSALGTGFDLLRIGFEGNFGYVGQGFTKVDASEFTHHDFLLDGGTVTFTTGATLTTQRAVRFRQPTYSATAATQAITDAYTVHVEAAPTVGSNVTITRSWAAGIGGNTEINGDLTVGTTGKSANIVGGANGTAVDVWAGGNNAAYFTGANTSADAAGLTLTAYVAYYETNSASHKFTSAIFHDTEGATANQRGGKLRFLTKPNGGTTLTERMHITQAGAVNIGTTTSAVGQADFSSGLTGAGRIVYLQSSENFALYSSTNVARVTLSVAGSGGLGQAYVSVADHASAFVADTTVASKIVAFEFRDLGVVKWQFQKDNSNAFNFYDAVDGQYVMSFPSNTQQALFFSTGFDGNIALNRTTTNVLSAGHSIDAWSATYPALALASTRADADAVQLGRIGCWYDTNSASHDIVAAVDFYSDGSTANQRGGRIQFFTKPNASTTLTERGHFSQDGTFRTSTNVVVGSLTAAANVFGSGASVDVWNSSAASRLTLVSSRGDADGADISTMSGWYDTNSATYKEIARITFESDGSTANQRGGKVRINTQANAAAGVVQRAHWNNAGIFRQEVNMIVGSLVQTPNSWGGGTLDRVVDVYSGGSPGYELICARADADAADCGGLLVSFDANTTGDPIAYINFATDGATANSRGGRIKFQTRANGSAGVVERMHIDKAGNVCVGTAALSTGAADGFLYVPTCAGTPTGTPTTKTGLAPVIIDTSNNRLYFYSGGAWRNAGP